MKRRRLFELTPNDSETSVSIEQKKRRSIFLTQGKDEEDEEKKISTTSFKMIIRVKFEGREYRIEDAFDREGLRS